MTGRMNRRPDPETSGAQDPFAPPGQGPDDSTFDLARDSGPHAAPPSQDVAPVVPQTRKPVAYKAPPGGLSNFVLWAFAGVGLLAVAGGSAWFFVGAARKATPVVAGAVAPVAAPAKPVVWKPVQTGDAVLVQVDAPRDARLLLDGEPLPSNPVRLVRGSVHTIAAVNPDGAQTSVKVTADAAKTVKLKLGRKRR
jgi:hypothetical protein